MINQLKIRHLVLGVILEENFINPIQFKLFLKLINGCFDTEKDLTYFNGNDCFNHIPFKILKECIITTHLISEVETTLTSKIESSLKKQTI